MNILVTGGAGYIGSICVEELLKQNHKVIVIDNLQEGHREAVLPDTTFYEGDIGDKELLTRIFTSHCIEVVMHFAAETLIGVSMRDPQVFFIGSFVLKCVYCISNEIDHHLTEFLMVKRCPDTAGEI